MEKAFLMFILGIIYCEVKCVFDTLMKVCQEAMSLPHLVTIGSHLSMQPSETLL